jgi:hypothetical protein
VPQGYKQDKSLGMWVDTQRVVHTKNKMRQDRKELLDDIGFVWKADGIATTHVSGDDKKWRNQYEKLVEFKHKNGHCLLPQKYKEDMSLGMWVNNQRGRPANNKLQIDRKKLLDEIDFVWRVDNDARWKKQYEQLVAFIRKNGDCLVPQGYEEDASLGKWVSKQRMNHASNIILTERKKLLDKIGFVWKAGTLTNVRGLVIASFHAFHLGYMFLTLVLGLLLTFAS